MEIAFTGQESIISGYESAISSHFRVLDNSLDRPDLETIMELLKNKTFNIENRLERQKDRDRAGFDEYGYLKEYCLPAAYEYHLLRIEHIKPFTKNELYDFLDKYLINKGWPKNQINQLATNVSWLKKDIERCSCDHFFVTCKDWLDKNDDALNDAELQVYPYYITLIWIDRPHYLISCCELLAD